MVSFKLVRGITHNKKDELSGGGNPTMKRLNAKNNGIAVDPRDQEFRLYATYTNASIQNNRGTKPNHVTNSNNNHVNRQNIFYDKCHV